MVFSAPALPPLQDHELNCTHYLTYTNWVYIYKASQSDIYIYKASQSDAEAWRVMN